MEFIKVTRNGKVEEVPMVRTIVEAGIARKLIFRDIEQAGGSKEHAAALLLQYLTGELEYLVQEDGCLAYYKPDLN